ncbi:sigma-70 family RNA polymerase sigma factor [Kineosporia rhizophila]|uniref:RNA polymerase sigma factor n=1 Tax=Kineosporia TaxID=49184 RepID=UPI000A61DD2A|nr:sigma-70 family RNA polymerase sigma factor [Kineosporia sp. NBRC 101677]MCE0534003.1 sigma-70 family RNA polymerase sigma factor [Kineosporia rhizophila]GLY13543.1 DNA-directed RNA polymerase sigma-70 factor [Kineosporia sp. NBRC 101677]
MGNPSEDDFRRLYADNFTAILNYARRRVQRPDDASDVVAETFLVAWRRRSEMPPGDDARLWLYGVARLVLSNHGRGERRRLRLGERLRREHRAFSIEADPSDEVLGVRAVREAMTGLSPNDREVLEMTVWEQLTPAEIAVALGLAPEVVRTRLSRARARMRKQLGQNGNDPGGGGHGHLVRIIPAPKEGKA